MNDTSPHYPVVQSIALDRSRRICLPRRLPIELPYYLVEVVFPSGQADQWLGICAAEALPERSAAGGHPLRVLSEHHTYRPKIPLTTCVKFGLIPGERLWLVHTQDWIGLWSDAAWSEQLSTLDSSAIVWPLPE